MNRKAMIFLSGIVLTLTGPSVSLANPTPDAGIEHLLRQAVAQTKEERLQQAAEGISEDAKDSVSLAQQAYQLLLQNKTGEAKDKTADALGHIPTEETHTRGKRLLSVNVVVQTVSGIDKLKVAETVQRKSLEALKQGKVQEARELLLPMIDEIDVQYLQLPMNVYTRYLRKAQEALSKKDRKTALASLAAAVSQLSLKTDVIPIPLVKAKELVRLAGTMAEADPAKALRLLKEANSYLRLSDIMGYTVADDMRVPRTIYKVRGKTYRASIREFNKAIAQESRKILSGIGTVHGPEALAMRQQLMKIIQTVSRQAKNQP